MVWRIFLLFALFSWILSCNNNQNRFSVDNIIELSRDGKSIFNEFGKPFHKHNYVYMLMFWLRKILIKWPIYIFSYHRKIDGFPPPSNSDVRSHKPSGANSMYEDGFAGILSNIPFCIAGLQQGNSKIRWLLVTILQKMSNCRRLVHHNRQMISGMAE